MTGINYNIPVPADFLDEKVVIFLNIPLQGKTGPKGEPGIMFPSFECTLLRQMDGALLVRDSSGDKIIPFHQIQSVLKPSAIQSVTGIVLPSIGRKN